MTEVKSYQPGPMEIITDPVRCQFLHVFEARPVSKTKKDDLKFQAVGLIPPGTDLTPFMEGYEAGWWYFNSKSNFMPGVVDQDGKDILDDKLYKVNPKEAIKRAQARIFSGCWVRFHLSAFPWNHPEGGKGVSFSLNGVQLVRTDTRFTQRPDARDVFDPVAMTDRGEDYQPASQNDTGAAPAAGGATDASGLFG
jgi:hypothetical protein